MKKLLFNFVLLLIVSCSITAQENWENTLDEFFKLNFEKCYPRFRYLSIEEITSVEELGNGTIIIQGKVVNGGNWRPVSRRFKATCALIPGSRKRKITVTKQVTGGDGRLIWKACEGEM